MLILHQFSMLKMYTKMKHILDCLLLELCGLPRGFHSGIRGHVSQVPCRSVFVLLSIYVLYYLWILMSWGKVFQGLIYRILESLHSLDHLCLALSLVEDMSSSAVSPFGISYLSNLCCERTCKFKIEHAYVPSIFLLFQLDFNHTE